MIVSKTKDHDIFKLREDNREKIDQTHVRRLVKSIHSRNLLEMRPISVNSAMEVIDGQHRLLAAKELGVEIYYQVDEKLQQNDIILMNIAKNWTMADYLNYYLKNGYSEYEKLHNFMTEHQISLKIALCIIIGGGHKELLKFKEGLFVFNEEGSVEEFKTCRETIYYIKRMNGYAAYTNSSRFWKALLKLVKHHDFNKKRWNENLSKMIERIGPRARTEDYMKLLTEVYNWRNNSKINV